MKKLLSLLFSACFALCIQAEGLTYEQQLLQVWELTGADTPLQTLKTKFANTNDTLSQMVSSYFEERGLRDFMEVCLPLYQENISQEELAVVAGIFSDKKYRTVSDSILYLSNLSMISWDSVQGTFVETEDAKNHPDYWEQRVACRLCLTTFAMTVAMEPLMADSVLQNSFERLDSLFTPAPSEEWMDAYLGYCRVNGIYTLAAKSFQTIIQLNPNALAELSEEQRETIIADYIGAFCFFSLPEYYRIATTEDLKHLTQLVSVEPYQHYQSVAGNLISQLFSAESNIWCHMAEKIYAYMAKHFPKNRSQLNIFVKEKDFMCGKTM